MKLTINNITKPFLYYNDKIIFRKNNTFFEINRIDLIEFIIKEFEDNTIIEKLLLKKTIMVKFHISNNECEDIINELMVAGIITEYIDKDRYYTNTLFFSLFNNFNKKEYQQKLLDTEICVLGLGGSTLIIQQLAALGVKKIVGVDFDSLEPKNLNRQVIFKESNVGELKAEVLKKNLMEINSDITYEFYNKKITSKEDVDEIIASSDIVILALDEPIIDSEIWVHQSCKSKNKILISGGVWGDIVSYVWFDYRNPDTPCYECMTRQSISDNPISLDYFKNIKGKCYPDFNTTIVFTASVLAGICVSEIAKIVTKYATPIDSCEILEVNTSTWEVNRTKFTKVEKCSLCNSLEFDIGRM